MQNPLAISGTWIDNTLNCDILRLALFNVSRNKIHATFFSEVFQNPALLFSTVQNNATTNSKLSRETKTTCKAAKRCL